MWNRTRVIGLIGVLAFGVVLVGQTRPNFSGRWVQVSPTEGAGTGQTIKHEGDRMSTGHDSEGGGHGINYRLDGVESRNVVTTHGNDIVSKTRAVWEGQQLVITSAAEYPDGRTMSDKQVWSLDSTGQLVITITRTMSGQEPMSIKAVFAKKTTD
jgi:hypothetical protein